MNEASEFAIVFATTGLASWLLMRLTVGVVRAWRDEQYAEMFERERRWMEP